MRDAVIVASSRTPLAKSHRGSFNMTRPDDLAAHCIRHVLGKIPDLDAEEIEEVIVGCGQPHGPAGHNVARVAALRAGLPVTVAASTVRVFVEINSVTSLIFCAICSHSGILGVATTC